MKYFSLLVLYFFISTRGISQDKKFEYYFDKDLNIVPKEEAVIYGVGENEGDHVRLMLYNNRYKNVIVIQHFTDSSLQVSDGLFTSFYWNSKKESAGNYSNNQKDDWWQRWDFSSGNLTDSIFYENGQASIDKAFSYFPDNKINTVFINNLKQHTHLKISYNESGEMIKQDTTSMDDDEDKVFTKEEIEAVFPGGEGAWKKYINGKIESQLDGSDYNSSCVIRFIVHQTGNISDVEAVQGNSKLANIVVTAIQKGPNWMPAQQNGRNVTAYKIIKVTYPAKE